MVDDGDEPGEWVSVSEAARRHGCSRRTIRDWLDHGKLTARPNNKGGRDVWVPATVRPVERPQAASGAPLAAALVTAASPMVVPADTLERERERREAAEAALVQVRADLALARREAELAQERLAEHQERERERVAELRAALDRERQDRERLADELRELRRPLWQRLLNELRRRRQQG